MKKLEKIKRYILEVFNSARLKNIEYYAGLILFLIVFLSSLCISIFFLYNLISEEKRLYVSIFMSLLTIPGIIFLVMAVVFGFREIFLELTRQWAYKEFDFIALFIVILCYAIIIPVLFLIASINSNTG